MSISALIAKVGEANVKVQSLQSDISTMRKFSDGSAILAFHTDAMCADSVIKMSQGIKGPVIGLVLWLPEPLVNAPTVNKP